MSGQEFVTPEQKHKWAEWKCPVCGEDGVWQGTYFWNVPEGPEAEDYAEHFAAEMYSCDTCQKPFYGSTFKPTDLYRGV